MLACAMEHTNAVYPRAKTANGNTKTRPQLNGLNLQAPKLAFIYTLPQKMHKM